MSEPLRYHIPEHDPASVFTGDLDFSLGRFIMSVPEPDPPHVWVVYDWDNGNRAYSIHLTAEDAVRGHSRGPVPRQIGKWPLGMELDEAIKAWEGR